MIAQEYARENEQSYSFTRFVADSLTLFRLFTSILLVALAVTAGADALKYAIAFVLLAWISDFLDGKIARNAGGKESWVGRLDHMIDNILIYSFFLFIVITGLFPAIPGVLLLGASGVIILMKPTESVVQMVSAPMFGLPIVLSPLAGWPIFGCLVIFLVIDIIVNRDKLKGFAIDAHHEASGQAGDELETDEGILPV